MFTYRDCASPGLIYLTSTTRIRRLGMTVISVSFKQMLERRIVEKGCKSMSLFAALNQFRTKLFLESHGKSNCRSTLRIDDERALRVGMIRLKSVICLSDSNFSRSVCSFLFI